MHNGKQGLSTPIREVRMVETPSSTLWRDVYMFNYTRTMEHDDSVRQADRAVESFQHSNRPPLS